MKIRTMLFSLTAISMCSAALAKSPFDGSWTAIIAKSHMNPEILSWKDAGNGKLKFTNANDSYTFKPNGQMFNTPLGEQQSFKEISNGDYRIVTKQNGILRITEILRISPDGNTFSLEGKGTMPGGQRFDNHSTYTRTSPGSGLVGDWKSTALAKVPPNTLTIRTSSNDDVTLTLSAIKATVNGKWDGRPYPVRSPIAPKGATAALSKIGTDGFKLKHYVGAMIVEVDQFTLVSDGRSMVEDGTNGKGRELFVNVWDRRLTVSPAFAQVQTSNDAIFGTWKLDVANSKLAGSPIKGDTLTIEPTANGFRLTQQSEFATGKLPAHVTVCNFDGRPCPTEADNSISTRRVNGYEIRTEMLHAGKQVGHQTTRVSKDRRTMTVDSWEQGAAGKPIHRVLVFQRQQQAGAP